MPPLTTKRYGVSDGKVYPVSQDDETGYAYGAGIDVPGIKAVTFDPSTTTKTLRGDNRLLDQFITLDAIGGTLAWAKDSLRLTAAALGLELVEDSGTAELAIHGEATPQPLRLEALPAMTDMIGGGQKIYVAKLYMVPIAGLAEEDYQTYSVPFVTAPTVWADPDGRHPWIGFVNSDTPLVLSV